MLTLQYIFTSVCTRYENSRQIFCESLSLACRNMNIVIVFGVTTNAKSCIKSWAVKYGKDSLEIFACSSWVCIVVDMHCKKHWILLRKIQPGKVTPLLSPDTICQNRTTKGNCMEIYYATCIIRDQYEKTDGIRSTTITLWQHR